MSQTEFCSVTIDEINHDLRSSKRVDINQEKLEEMIKALSSNASYKIGNKMHRLNDVFEYAFHCMDKQYQSFSDEAIRCLDNKRKEYIENPDEFLDAIICGGFFGRPTWLDEIISCYSKNAIYRS